MKENTHFEISEEKQQQLQSMFNDINAFCVQERIPIFISAAVKNDETGTQYLSDMIAPSVLSIGLDNDKIPEYVKILNGFVAVPEDEPIILEF